LLRFAPPENAYIWFFGAEKNNVKENCMPRANRHFTDGLVWHITHRCHKQQFLLKFKKDRLQWLRWLYRARRRYGLCILNYVVTSNHVHLLVLDRGKSEIARSMQLVAGCTAQQYNRRKGRKGAFWEDRYFATAVQCDSHLARCLVYIDLNMVRAGVVQHPVEWPNGGYREIQRPPERYRLIDSERLPQLLGFNDVRQMRKAHCYWVQGTLASGRLGREPQWSESVAVGHPRFLAEIRRQLHLRCPGRRIVSEKGDYQLREAQASYVQVSGPRK
jgi:putative transposase